MSALVLPNADRVTHRTGWRLEKRHGDVGLYVSTLAPEAEEVLLRGRKPWSGDLNTHALAYHTGDIREWLRHQPPDIAKLWNEKRVIGAALHNIWLDKTLAQVEEREGNILVTAGIALFLDLMTGAGGTVWSNANANLGVGDSSAAAAVGQTDLQASSNKLRKGMNATYPTKAAPAINFQSTFGSTEGNYVWNEVATFNAASVGTMLNRVVQSLGTKSGGSTWTLTETITWS